MGWDLYLGTRNSPPNWLQQQSFQTWSAIAPSGINAVNPNFSGVASDQNRVIDKWSGGAAWGSSFYIHGGGHTDTGENSLYLLDLAAPTPAWTRPIGPTVDTSGGDQTSNGAANYADGAPRSTHSQQRLVATPEGFWVVGCDNFLSSAGLDSSAVFHWPTGAGSWTAMGPQLNSTEWGAGLFGWHGGGSVYDRTSGWIWMLAQQTGLATDTCAVLINATTRATRKVKGYFPFSYQWAVIAHDLRKLFVGEGGGGLFVFDITSLPNDGDTITRTTCFVSGTSTPGWLPNATADHGGAVYHQASRAILAWNGHGANVVKIAIPADLMAGTYTVSTVSPASNNAVTPSSPTATGTFGRFNLCTVGGIDVLVVCNDYQQPTYVYKLPVAGL